MFEAKSQITRISRRSFIGGAAGLSAALMLPLAGTAQAQGAAAQKIAEKSSLSVMAAKEAVNRSYETTLREGILFERRIFHALFNTEDQKEGMSAFLEKREAQFRDR